MNKYIVSFAFLAHTMLFTQAPVANSFEKFLPSITKDAITWASTVTNTLNNDLQLAYLNLFALNSESSIQGFIKCAEFIESQKDMLPTYEQLSFNIIQKIKKYVEGVQAKIAQRKTVTKPEEEKLLQKLEAKIQELVAYINAIYYNVLYGAVATKTSSAPLYMFDENGIIPQEKRTKRLPQPE
jgi:hypothetical protein